MEYMNEKEFITMLQENCSAISFNGDVIMCNTYEKPVDTDYCYYKCKHKGDCDQRNDVSDLERALDGYLDQIAEWYGVAIK